jgi:hypothetical protein
MRADHEDPLIVAQHPKLLVQRNGPATGGRLELRRRAVREEEEQDEERGTSGQ